MATVKHREWVEMWQIERVEALTKELAEAKGQLKDETQRRRNAERDLKFVAKFFCKSRGFLNWLLLQDLSSSRTYRPVAERGVPVEGRDDVELAIEFCKWIDRQGQNPTS